MPQPGSLTHGKTILLVDDEPLVRMGVAQMLEELDYIVIEASTAADGLRFLADNGHIEILISDLQMPDMDGIELIHQAQLLNKEVKALIMSGHDADGARFNGVSAPRLAKPFGLFELQTAISNLA
jgi:CheY-like chemotaxis protein